MISHDDLIEQHLGPIGTPERDRFEIKHLFRAIAYDIRHKRRELNLSQEDLAKRTGIKIQDIKRIERGGVTSSIPGIHRIWLELGMHFRPGNKIYDDFHKSKSRHKKKLTKQSSPLRTIVR